MSDTNQSNNSSHVNISSNKATHSSQSKSIFKSDIDIDVHSLGSDHYSDEDDSQHSFML